MKEFMDKAGWKVTDRVSVIAGRRIMQALLAAILASGTGMGLTVASAGVQIAPAGVSTAKNVAPDTNYVTLRFLDGKSYSYPCDGGSTYGVNARVDTVFNRCNVRVWLHQTPTNKGVNWCVDPLGTSNPPNNIYFANAYVSTNADRCSTARAGRQFGQAKP